MKDKLNRFMQGAFGVDNFARFTLGVALFVIVVGSFMRQNAAGGVLDTVDLFLSFIHISESFPEISLARYAENQKYLGYTQKIRSRFTQREKYDGAEKTHHILYLPGLWTENSYSQRKGQKVEIECPKCHEKFIKRR